MPPYDPERRRVPRLALHQPVIVRCLEGNLREVAAVAREASAGGIFVTAEVEIPKGCAVEISFALPGGPFEAGGLHFQASGRVIRVHKEDKGFGTAIVFDKLQLKM